MNSQDLRNLQEAYLGVYEGAEGGRFEYNQRHGRPLITPEVSQSRSSQETLGGGTYVKGPKRLPKSKRKYDRQVLSGVRAASEQEKQRARERMGIREDIYDIILSHLLDEGYADTFEGAQAIMVNMSEDWREDIVEATVLAAKGGVAGAVQVKQTKTPGFLGTGFGSKTVSTPIPGTFTRNTPGRVQSGPRPFDAYGYGSKGAEAEMSDRSGPTDAERNRYNDAVTKNNTVGDKSVEPSPRAVNQRAYQKGHSGLMPTRDNQNSTTYTKPNQSWRGY
ncbi:MAG: hypothetical protein EBU90_31160 [Proteobacteria bacterium]|nr:hypothetical protein [Pseudomonadota bacterium]